MEGVIVFIIFVALIAGMVSLIAVLYPLPKLWLPTRKRAGSVLALSFGLMIVGGALLPKRPPPTPEELATQAEAKKQTAQARAEARMKEAEAKRQKARARIISTITFSRIHNLFGREGGLTELQKDREWKKYQGKCVEWTGELVNLDEGFLSGLNIGFKHARDTLMYDVVVSAPKSEERRLLTWRKGQHYTYQATLKRPGGAFLPISADWGCD